MAVILPFALYAELSLRQINRLPGFGRTKGVKSWIAPVPVKAIRRANNVAKGTLSLIRQSHSRPSLCIKAGARFTVPASKLTDAPRWERTGTRNLLRFRFSHNWPFLLPKHTTRKSASTELIALITEILTEFFNGQKARKMPSDTDHAALGAIQRFRCRRSDTLITTEQEKFSGRSEVRRPLRAAKTSDPATLSLIGTPRSRPSQTIGIPSAGERSLRSSASRNSGSV